MYDVLIVGAGISGSEAALACADMGLDTLLVTTSLDTVYNLLGKGVALTPPVGTFMAEACASLADTGGWISNWGMHCAAKQRLEQNGRIHLLQSSVSGLIVQNTEVVGVTTWEGVPRYARLTVLCVGSFLQARLTMGRLTEVAGRLSEMAYDDLYLDLAERGFQFEALELRAEAQEDGLPYSVTAKRFADTELEHASFRLRRYDRLYAAGVCAFGFLSYEQAAQQGRLLATVVQKTIAKAQ